MKCVATGDGADTLTSADATAIEACHHVTLHRTGPLDVERVTPITPGELAGLVGGSGVESPASLSHPAPCSRRCGDRRSAPRIQADRVTGYQEGCGETRRSAGSTTMKRLGILLVVLWMVALPGCGRSQDRGGPVTLVLKHAKILGPVDPIPQLLAEFEAGHPGVRVKAEVLPWSSDEQRQFLVINLEGGRPGFVVMMLDCIWVPEFAKAGWLLDLTPGVSLGDLSAHFHSAVDAGTYEGRTWALPWFMNVGLLYYRADLLARHGFSAPSTYAEMLEQIRVIRAA